MLRMTKRERYRRRKRPYRSQPQKRRKTMGGLYRLVTGQGSPAASRQRTWVPLGVMTGSSARLGFKRYDTMVQVRIGRPDQDADVGALPGESRLEGVEPSLGLLVV